MGFWKMVLQAVAASYSASNGDAKIQIRGAGDSYWRDCAYSASNDESIQNAMDLAASSNPGCSVRAVSSSGSVIDIR
jgi:hypothetical protein